MTGDQVLDAARALAPTIAARAADVEAARRVPGDLLDALVAAGCFRMLLPRSHGGAGADLPSALRLYETLAGADASVAWTVMIGGSAWVDLTELPRTTFDGLFAGDDVIVAGAFAPSGSITPDAGGYRVTGRWGFASGCEHATVLYGNCIESGADGGGPPMRMALFDPDQVEIEDTWTVSGLRGTGSHHIRVADLRVTADRTWRPLGDEPCLDEPVVRVPVPSLIALMVAGIGLGVAQAALDDAVGLAGRRVPLLADAPLAADALFQADLATADTELCAARALLNESAASLWATAVSGGPLGMPQRARTRAAAAWVVRRAVAVVETAYRSGGGSAIYTTCPLERRLRDIHTLQQHFIVRPNTMTTAGAVLLGRDVDVLLF